MRARTLAGALTGLIGVTMLPSAASAYAWVSEVKITAIEVTYMPNSIPIYADRAVGSCAAGGALTWSALGSTPEERAQNAQGVLATLLTAKASGQTVRVYVATNCKIEYLYIT